MGTEKRLAAILERQAAAAEAKRRRDEEAAEVGRKAAEQRAKAEATWSRQYPLLQSAIDDLNSAMSSNGIELSYRQTKDDRLRSQIADLEVRFANERDMTGIKRLHIVIGSQGNVSVSMGTSSQSPAKRYNFALEEATGDRWKETILDFVDINTPT